MATRFYFSANDAPAIDPGVPFSGWDSFGEWVVRALITEKRANDVVTAGTAIGPVTVFQKVLDRQYVYGPIEAVTISGAVKCQSFAKESSGAMDVNGMFIRIGHVKANGTANTDIFLVNRYGSSVELGTDYRNSIVMNGDTPPGGSVSVPAGDYLLVELGYVAWTYTGDCTGFYGTGDGSDPMLDLPYNDETETDTTSYCGWIEFTETITLQAAGAARKLRGHLI